MSTLSPQKVMAAPNCLDVISACDKALDSKEKEIDQYKLGIDMLNKQNVELGSNLQDRDEQLGSIWHNPFVMIGLGVLAGGAAALVLTK